MLQAEKQWNYGAFLDYCDRWMTEPDPGYGTCSAGFSYQGGTWDPFFKQMWRAYRNNLPAIDGKKVDRPPAGWKIIQGSSPRAKPFPLRRQRVTPRV